ncbi:MAG: Rrf2 family transcriptional regulator [Nevskiaceae bacterium]|jgi:Rrf2 family nitric oxide-sensitive transcriptional repressor|nr:Rrf2 family transcriptional regulator [Nevskiaceae bacterium]
MQLTQYTDYALRTLIALGLAYPRRMTVGDISAAYHISRHHLVKITARLAELGYVETLRGKGGGMHLARDASQIVLGEVVRNMEAELAVVPCLKREGGNCVIVPCCKLMGVLARATHHFMAELDAHTLADVLQPRLPLSQLLGIPVVAQTPRSSPDAG